MDLLLRGSLPGYLQYSMAESSAMHPGTFVGPEMEWVVVKGEHGFR